MFEPIVLDQVSTGVVMRYQADVQRATELLVQIVARLVSWPENTPLAQLTLAFSEKDTRLLVYNNTTHRLQDGVVTPIEPVGGIMPEDLD
jgi:hypothetical protein